MNEDQLRKEIGIIWGKRSPQFMLFNQMCIRLNKMDEMLPFLEGMIKEVDSITQKVFEEEGSGL